MAFALVLMMLSMSSHTQGRGFRQRSGALQELVRNVRMDAQLVHQELQEALRGALGHGHAIDRKQILAANATLLPMFQSLPKNEHGRVSSAAMRYAVQRYFSKNHGWIIKGFESHSAENQTRDAGILANKVPGYVEATLEAILQKGGFSLPDILTVVIVVERLIFDEVARSIEAAYHLNHLTTDSPLDHESLVMVIESHLIVEMLERHVYDEEVHQEDRQEIHELYPNWDALQEFMRDVIDMETSVVLGSGRQNPFSRSGIFSYDDAVRIAQRISNEYGRWGNQECMELRSFLADLDTTATGRVALSRFYGAGQSDDRWSFLETPEYLRELGAVDDSSKALGPQVIITNYAYGMSNCLTSTPYYSVCCLNECEGLLQQLELHVAKPSATPTEILDAVHRIRTPFLSSTFSDASGIDGRLQARLEEMATKGHGKVSLHGRLFAQWLHYVFPHECPFPHIAGSVGPQTQGERLANGEEIFIEPDELSKRLQQFEVHNNETSSEGMEEDLWSWDEELMHAPESATPSSPLNHGSAIRIPWAGIVALGVLLIVMRINTFVAAVTKRRMLLPTIAKSHDL
jgi:hypothetical protein